MKSTKTKLCTAILATILATSFTACGGGGGNDDPTVVTVSKTLRANSTYSNKLFCYDPQTTEGDKKEEICNIRMYQIMVEAFNNGDNSINYGVGYGTSNHKGDIQGVIDELKYIKGLGINAIWLTPVFQSAGNGKPVTALDATGYFGEDYFKVDPHFGSEDVLRTLVDEAHAKGMYVFLDGVFGHFKSSINTTSPEMINLKTTDTCQGIGKTYPAGDGTLCANHSQEATREFYKEVATHYITEYKIDGWRLDQAYQVPVANWKAIREAVEDAAKTVTYQRDGQDVNPLGYMVGEIWSGEQQIKDYGYGSNTTPGLKSNFDFNTRYGIVQALAVEESGASNHSATFIRDKLKTAESVYPEIATPNYFLGNHDLVRFGDLIQRAQKLGALKKQNYFKRYKLAHSVIATLSGPVTLYYGDEWGQEVPNFDIARGYWNEKGEWVCTAMNYCEDHVARVNGQFEGFNADQENLKSFVTKLMKLREKSKAISMGKMIDLGTDENVFVVKKTYGDSDVLVLINIQDNKQIDIDFDASLFSDAAAENSVSVLTSENFDEAETLLPEGTTYKLGLEPLTAAIVFIPPSN